MHSDSAPLNVMKHPATERSGKVSPLISRSWRTILAIVNNVYRDTCFIGADRCIRESF